MGLSSHLNDILVVPQARKNLECKRTAAYQVETKQNLKQNLLGMQLKILILFTKALIYLRHT